MLTSVAMGSIWFFHLPMWLLVKPESLFGACDSFRHNISERPFTVKLVELNEAMAVSAGGVQSFDTGSANRGKIVTAMVDLARFALAEVTAAIVSIKRHLANGLPQLALEVFLVLGNPKVSKELAAVCVSKVRPLFDFCEQRIESLRKFATAIFQDASDSDCLVEKVRASLERAIVPEELIVGETFHAKTFRAGALDIEAVFPGLSGSSIPLNGHVCQTTTEFNLTPDPTDYARFA